MRAFGSRVFTSCPALCCPSLPFGRQVREQAKPPLLFIKHASLYQRPLPHTHLRIQIGSSLQLFTPSLSLAEELVRLGWDKQDKIPASKSLLSVDPQARTAQIRGTTPITHLVPRQAEYGSIKEADSLSLPVSQDVRLGRAAMTPKIGPGLSASSPCLQAGVKGHKRHCRENPTILLRAYWLGVLRKPSPILQSHERSSN